MNPTQTLALADQCASVFLFTFLINHTLTYEDTSPSLQPWSRVIESVAFSSLSFLIRSYLALITKYSMFLRKISSRSELVCPQYFGGTGGIESIVSKSSSPIISEAVKTDLGNSSVFDDEIGDAERCAIDGASGLRTVSGFVSLNNLRRRRSTKKQIITAMVSAITLHTS